jgi:hypothetical protein
MSKRFRISHTREWVLFHPGTLRLTHELLESLSTSLLGETKTDGIKSPDSLLSVENC